ncbi:nicotinamide-nucleotide amidase [Lachnospiraceae bacterium RM5]|nr:nicotinamide-nucleotide amidase [Lachnospiraceae bacterium RM5]
MKEEIVDFLLNKKMHITTVESCTGGMLASEIVSVPGASEVFNEGYVTYSAEAKERIVGVSHETIEKYNVVSENVAAEMAKGGAKISGADIAVSITGLAGPSGGTEYIPVGTVCIGIYFDGNIYTERYIFGGYREKIRRSAVEKAFLMLKNILGI